MDPWIKSEEKPKRALVLIFNHLNPESGDLALLPHFQRLKNRSLSFEQAWLGHLFATPAVSNLVLTTGLSPRHLPWDDVLWEDKRGILGKKGAFHAIENLSPSGLNKILTPVAPSLLKQIPGSANSKLVVAPNTAEAYSLASPGFVSQIVTGSPSPTQREETWVTDEVLSFLKSQPDWKLVLAMFSNSLTDLFQVDEQLGRILTCLEENKLLSDTVIILTSHPTQPAKTRFDAPKPENIQTEVKDTVLRFHLKNKDEKSVLKFSASLKTKPELSEVHYKKEISGRFHYIKNFRSSELEGSQLEWAKNQVPSLLQSLASEKSPDVLAFTAFDPQRVPLLVWSPNLRLDNPVIKNQLEQTRVRFVDIHPILLELMGLPIEPGSDGSSLGIKSLIY